MSSTPPPDPAPSGNVPDPAGPNTNQSGQGFPPAHYDQPGPAAPAGQPWPSGSPVGWAPPGAAAPAAPASTRAPINRSEVRAAVIVAVVLVVVGVLLGFAWAAWAHGSSQAGSKVFSTSIGNIPDESEGFIAGDGRFAALTGAVGLLAGLFAWFRRRTRGPVMPLALGLGGLAGAALTAWVGHLVSSGRTSAPQNQIFVAKLSLQAHGLLVLEAGVALLVYLVCTLVIGSDALGREDETPAAAPPPPDQPAWTTVPYQS